MPASEKVSVQQIVNALLKWNGEVAGAARELGLHRASLYERMKRLDINPDAFRKVSGARVSGMSGVSGDTSGGPLVSGFRAVEAGVGKKHGVVYPREAGAPTVRRMQTVAKEQEADELPIRTRVERDRPMSVIPAHRKLIKHAAWTLQAEFKAPVDENQLLEQFIDEAFEPWLRSKLTTKRVAPKGKAKDSK